MLADRLLDTENINLKGLFNKFVVKVHDEKLVTMWKW